MKNTRRAAAAWMTMSLAVSTVLGNTAWGDVLQETGKNRCVHVHTAECYGDADETATMSQTGELEPTECTHVCSVESGCILDTENLENNDADAWKVGTPSNADQKGSGDAAGGDGNQNGSETEDGGGDFCQYPVQCGRYHNHRWNCHASYTDEDLVLVLV